MALSSRIDAINELAEASPGFVWRLRGEETAIEDLRPLEPYVECDVERLFYYNMSVWESLEHLQRFIHKTGHIDFLRRRHEWIEPVARPATALWWIPQGHRPSVKESIGMHYRGRRFAQPGAT